MLEQPLTQSPQPHTRALEQLEPFVPPPPHIGASSDPPCLSTLIGAEAASPYPLPSDIGAFSNPPFLPPPFQVLEQLDPDSDGKIQLSDLRHLIFEMELRDVEDSIIKKQEAEAAPRPP